MRFSLDFGRPRIRSTLRLALASFLAVQRSPKLRLTFNIFPLRVVT